MEKLSDEDWKRTSRLYKEGVTLSQLAKRFAVSHQTIRTGLAKRSVYETPQPA